MMGVSPVTLDDVTSGFNIGWHISTKPEFDKMLGFSTEDVRAMFTRYRDAGQIPADSNIEAMIEEIKPWYDNYCFAKQCLRKKSGSSIAIWYYIISVIIWTMVRLQNR